MLKPINQLNVDDRMTALHQLATLGWRLSTYAASINWNGSPNEREWLSGFQECIEAYQGVYTGLFGEQPGMKTDAAALPVERTAAAAILIADQKENYERRHKPVGKARCTCNKPVTLWAETEEWYQGVYTGLFGEQPGMKIDAAALPVERTAITFSEGQVNTFHKGLALQAIAKFAEKTNVPADAFVWIDKPVTGCWYDFYDLATQKYGQCRLGPDGWAQEPRGLFPTLMALRGE